MQQTCSPEFEEEVIQLDPGIESWRMEVQFSMAFAPAFILYWQPRWTGNGAG
jgi:hypothetical protein